MRLIDADALKQYYSANLEKPPRSIFGVMAQMELKELIDIINECVDKQPTIEPERKIGTWEPVEEIPSIRKRFKRYCCSGCKKEGFDTWNFCPVCGQRNREGEHK